MKKLLSSSAVFGLVLVLLLGMLLQPNEAGRMQCVIELKFNESQRMRKFTRTREGKEMKKVLNSSAAFAVVLVLLLLGLWLQPSEAGRMLIEVKQEDKEAVRAKYQLSGLLAFNILQKGLVPPAGEGCLASYTCPQSPPM